MIKSYLKISIAVLLRRKFLTFVNLFGTVLTLTVLVTAFAIFESIVSPAGAQHRQDRILLIDSVTLSHSNLAISGSSGPGFAFYERYIEPLETPDLVSLATAPRVAASYVDGRKITSRLRRTDAAYWQILDFDVLAGRTFSADDVEQGRFVAVINEATAGAYFPAQPAVGKQLVIDSQSFEVVGVVANEPVTSRLAYSDIWIPLTAAESTAYAREWLSDNQAMLYVGDPAERRAAQDEYRERLRQFEYPVDPDQYDTADSAALTSLEAVASATLERVCRVGCVGGPSPVAELIGTAIVVALLFMALPAINMANLNVGRILERAPEIGLRKAAGAPTGVLVGQFVFENVVLAALGGLLAFAIAPIVLRFLNRTVFTYGQLALNVPILAVGLALIVVFGVLSGAYPAWKMARLDAAAALRGQRHA